MWRSHLAVTSVLCCTWLTCNWDMYHLLCNCGFHSNCIHTTFSGHVQNVQARAGPDGPELTDVLWARTLWAELKGLLNSFFFLISNFINTKTRNTS